VHSGTTHRQPCDNALHRDRKAIVSGTPQNALPVGIGHRAVSPAHTHLSQKNHRQLQVVDAIAPTLHVSSNHKMQHSCASIVLCVDAAATLQQDLNNVNCADSDCGEERCLSSRVNRVDKLEKVRGRSLECLDKWGGSCSARHVQRRVAFGICCSDVGCVIFQKIPGPHPKYPIQKSALVLSSTVNTQCACGEMMARAHESADREREDGLNTYANCKKHGRRDREADVPTKVDVSCRSSSVQSR
jgi:hypothetical protein